MMALTPAQVCEILDPLKVLEVSEKSGWWQTILAEKLLATGVAVDTLTIGGFRAIVADASAEFTAEFHRLNG